MSWRSYITRKIEDDFGGNQRALARALQLSRFEDVNEWLRQGRVPRPETAERIVTDLGDDFTAVSAEIYAPEDPIEVAITSDRRLSNDQKKALLHQLKLLRTDGRKRRKVTEKKPTG